MLYRYDQQGLLNGVSKRKCLNIVQSNYTKKQVKIRLFFLKRGLGESHIWSITAKTKYTSLMPVKVTPEGPLFTTSQSTGWWIKLWESRRLGKVAVQNYREFTRAFTITSIGLKVNLTLFLRNDVCKYTMILILQAFARNLGIYRHMAKVFFFFIGLEKFE